MYITITRTFTELKDTADDETDFEYWARYVGLGHEHLTWEGLEKHPVAVVLGEARSGKTEEFRQRAARLRAEGKFAFFLRLDEVAITDFNDCLDVAPEQFEAWCASNAIGFFFLDSVDEARLAGPLELKAALRKTSRILNPYFSRAHVLITSRIGDWMLPAVREAVGQLAGARANAVRRFAEIVGGTVVAAMDEPDEVPPAYLINPLTRPDVIAIANGLGVRKASDLWDAIANGGYEHYATRPGDLTWLVQLWEDEGRLGTLTELTEASIRQRLLEVNDQYVARAATLDFQRLRMAVEMLAAASIFSGRAQFDFNAGGTGAKLVQASEVLVEMTPLEQQRVLGSAVFDTNSLGRVRFHHRSVREYLAASWVAKQLDAGLPLARALEYFVRSPFGKPVLLTNRRGTLAWLATMSSAVREYVVDHFPEMLMFEGDPAAWSRPEVVSAFERFLSKVGEGVRFDWWNDRAEYARLARVLPPDVITAALNRYRDLPGPLYRLFEIVSIGLVRDCADTVFGIYCDDALLPSIRSAALDALRELATMEQRSKIRSDLVSEKLTDNKLRGAALTVVGMDALSDAELDALLRLIPIEEHYNDRLTQAISGELLPELTRDASMRLLTSIYRIVDGETLSRKRRWLGDEQSLQLGVTNLFGDVLERALDTQPVEGEPSDELIKFVVFAEKLNHSRFLDAGDLKKLGQKIAKKPILFRRVAVAIGIAETVVPIGSQLVGWSGLVNLRRDDLDIVVGEAMTEHAKPAEREVWFRAAVDLTYTTKRGQKRRDALQLLVVGKDAVKRDAYLKKYREWRLNGLRARRESTAKAFAQGSAVDDQHTKLVQYLSGNISGIRAGTHVGALSQLMYYARDSSDFNNLDPYAVRKEFGDELAAAFAEGLQIAYLSMPLPDMMEQIGHNSVPWAGLIGLASSSHALRSGVTAGTSLDALIRAVRFAVWSNSQPAPWVEQAFNMHREAITQDLMPIFQAELTKDELGHHCRVSAMIFRLPPKYQRPFLDAARQLIESGKVTSSYLRQQLFQALREQTGVESTLCHMARSELQASVAKGGAEGLEARWLFEWLSLEPDTAWAWIKSLVPSPFTDNAALAMAISTGGRNVDQWSVPRFNSPGAIAVLMDMFRFVNAAYPLDQPGALPEAAPMEFLNRLLTVLAGLGTQIAHNALRQLADENRSTDLGHWIGSRAETIAATIGEQAAIVAPRDLRSMHDIFLRDPATEVELLEQVVARIGDIKHRLEKGKFSEREIFTPGMPEKTVQKYLASRLSDTAVRHFVVRDQVLREPEVDHGNKPDITVAAAAGQVPVEVKPVDSTRYSANSLSDTLRTQVAGKYLAHGDSRHAVLVVMNLEEKRWEIPGGRRDGNFEDLIAYLRTIAIEVAHNDPNVARIEVIGIDCVDRGSR